MRPARSSRSVCAAQTAGIVLDATATSRTALPGRWDEADTLLIGPHLPDLEELQQEARRHGVVPVVLPEDVFTDLDGSRILRLIAPAPTL